MKEQGLKEGLHKALLVGMALVVVLVLCPALIGIGVSVLFSDSAVAATSCNIDITATGSEVDISCNVTHWSVGFVSASTHYTTNSTHGTANTWGQITNDGSEAVDLTVYGNDMAGGAVTWTLSTGGAGAATIRMQIGLPTNDNFTIQTEAAAPHLTWKDELASAGTQTFGLDLDSPTSGVGNEWMIMGNGGAGPAGVVITGSID